MKVLFGYQDVLKVVNNGVTPLVAGATEMQKVAHRKENKKDYKTLFLISSRVDNDNFEKVGDCNSTKQTYEILKKVYKGGADKKKVVKLETHNRQF